MGQKRVILYSQPDSNDLCRKRSCTLILRINATDLSQAICQVSTRRLSLLRAGLQSLVQPDSPPRGHTCHIPSDEHDPRPLLIALGAAATAAGDSATRLEASTLDPSARRPSPVCRAATAGLHPCRWSAQAQPEARVARHAASRNCDRCGTALIASASPLHAYTPCSLDGRWRRHADGHPNSDPQQTTC
jgi:hypothetical protein